MKDKIKNIINTEEKKRILSNFFSLSILQIFTYILPLLTLPYLVRVLGVEKFGLIMFAQSFIMLFNILVDYGFNLSATREVSVNRDSKDKLTEIFSSVIMIKIIFVGVSFILLSIIIFTFEKFSHDRELYLLTFLTVIGQAMFPIWYFQGIEKMKYITIVNIVSKIIFTVLIFVFIQNKSDYILVPILNGFGFIVAGIISLYIVIYKFQQPFKMKSIKLQEYLQNGYHVFLSIASSTTLSVSPVIFIGIFIDYFMVGYYSAFEKLIFAMKSFFYIINQTFFPRLSKLYIDNKDKYYRIWRKISFYTIIFSVVLFISLFSISDTLIEYYYGKIFLEYSDIFHILSFTIVLYAIINALGLNGLLVMGRHKQLSISQVIPAIFFLIVSPFVLKVFGLFIFLYFIVFIDLIIILIRIYFLREFYYGKS